MSDKKPVTIALGIGKPDDDDAPQVSQKCIDAAQDLLDAIASKDAESVAMALQKCSSAENYKDEE